MHIYTQGYPNDDGAKIDGRPLVALPLTYFLFARGLTGAVFVAVFVFVVFAFLSADGLSMISISESALIVDALRLPAAPVACCLLPAEDRSKSGRPSDLDAAEARVCDCCVGLCRRDDVADWRDHAGDAGDMPLRAANAPGSTSSSSRRAGFSSASGMRVSAQSRANTLSPPSASWKPRGVFSDRTVSPVARAAKRSRERDALLLMVRSPGVSLAALSPKLSTQSHGWFMTGAPGTVCPEASTEAYTKSATPS